MRQHALVVVQAMALVLLLLIFQEGYLLYSRWSASGNHQLFFSLASEKSAILGTRFRINCREGGIR